MPLRLTGTTTALDQALVTLREEQHVPGGFPPEVEAEAARVAAAPRMPDDDATDLALVTLDPPGSKDLDQAVLLERDGDRYVVHYAIADVAAFVEPGGEIDQECHRRGSTLYLPDGRVPLHPPALSEAAASLLPDQVRPAVLWRFVLDADGEVVEHAVRRARVRSVAQLDYPSVQSDLDGGPAHPSLALLPDVGRRRQALARARDAVELDLPEQEVVETGGRWTLEFRAPLPCEGWNAEISLLTGITAAGIMLDGGAGILRTLPPPTDGAVRDLRRAAAALGVAWPEGASPGAVVATVSRTDPKHVAFLEQAAHLLRGASYAAFLGTPPKQPLHAGLGTPYAHATAPLRRLVDRYVSECCLALSAGTAIPDWVVAALPGLPETMDGAGQRESRLEAGVVDTAEALLLADRVGTVFDADVVAVSEDKKGEPRATVVLDEPAVRASCRGALTLGERAKVRLVEADPAKHLVRFEAVP